MQFFLISSFILTVGALHSSSNNVRLHSTSTCTNGARIASRFSSMASARRLIMSDPDTPPEVNPTRRDPDEPGPDIPIRLPVVDFGTVHYRYQ